MASIQELETRVTVIEDKLDFLMRAMPLKVAHSLMPNHIEVKPALEVYRMIKGLGMEIQDAPRQESSPILGANGEQLLTSFEDKN